MEDALHINKTTFRVADFLAWQRHSALDLRPPFQRGIVWTARAKSAFIDTMIRGFPVPLIFLKDETDPNTFEPRRLVVDGQQRLRSVLSFVDIRVISDVEDADHFTISRTQNPDPNICGKQFLQLPDEIKSRILGYEFAVHVLPPATPNRVLLDMFARLNSTGTKLSDQEVRNAEFTGEFKITAYGLAYDFLEDWLLWKVFSPVQVARMKEVELTSELMIFLEEGVKSKSQVAIRKAYENNEETYDHRDKVIDRFSRVMAVIEDVDRALPDGLARSPFNSQAWFYALFVWIHDQMYEQRIPRGSNSPKGLNLNAVTASLINGAQALGAGGLPEALVKALRGAASDRSSRDARVKFLRDN